MSNVVPFRSKQPWLDEPDQVSQKQGAYHLVIFRHPINKNLNGYVGVPPGSVLYGREWSRDKEIERIHVHGGITFTDKGDRFGPPFEESYWYFGFDTAHFMDYVPGLVELLESLPRKEPIPNSIRDNVRNYRDIRYVSAEVQSLYRQLKKIQNIADYNKRMKKRRPK